MSNTENQNPKSEGGAGVSQLMNDIEKDFSKVTPLLHLASMVKIPPGQLAIGGFILCMSCIIFGFMSEVLTALIGILYPAYMSFKAIETKEDEDDDKQWLTYWVVFSFTHVFDKVFHIFLSFMPFYYPLKVLFYVFLFYPKTKGALLIYTKFLQPFLLSEQEKIDNLLQKGKDKVKQTIESAAYKH